MSETYRADDVQLLVSGRECSPVDPSSVFVTIRPAPTAEQPTLNLTVLLTEGRYAGVEARYRVKNTPELRAMANRWERAELEIDGEPHVGRGMIEA